MLNGNSRPLELPPVDHEHARLSRADHSAIAGLLGSAKAVSVNTAGKPAVRSVQRVGL